MRSSLVLAITLGGACGLAGACGSSGDSSPASKVDDSRYAADLMAIAGTRSPDTAHWQEVQDLCASRFESLGYTVERHAYATGVNVIGVREGTGAQKSERIIVSAHYDSVPNCEGADDNGTGVAGVLETARVMADVETNRTLVVACWDEEELGLIGSRAFVEREVAAGVAPNYKASYVYEMIGYKSDEPNTQMTNPELELVYSQQTRAIADNEYRGDFILVVHDDSAATAVMPLLDQAQSDGLPTIVLPVEAMYKKSSLFDGLRRSDHAPFWDADIPAVQITDTADFRNSHDHCYQSTMDAVADINISFATSVVRATVTAVAAALGT